MIPTSDFFSRTAMCLLFPTNYALIAYLVNDLSSISSTSMHMVATLNCFFSLTLILIYQYKFGALCDWLDKSCVIPISIFLGRDSPVLMWILSNRLIRCPEEIIDQISTCIDNPPASFSCQKKRKRSQLRCNFRELWR